MRIAVFLAGLLIQAGCGNSVQPGLEPVWGTPRPVSEIWKTSTDAVVARINRIKYTGVSATIGPGYRIPLTRVYLCQADLSVTHVLKGVLREPVISVLWYRAAPGCSMPQGLELGKGEAIWLLQKRGDVVRVTDDFRQTAIVLRRDAHWQELTKGQPPDEAFARLFLIPGLLKSEEAFPRAIPGLMGTVIDVAGGFDRAVGWISALFQESNVQIQQALCIYLAEYYSLCVDCANSALAARRASDVPGQRLSFHFTDKNNLIKSRERDLRALSGSSLEELVQRMPAQNTEAVRKLLWIYACRADLKIRARARELLREHFGVHPTAITCVPCDAADKH